MSDPLDTRSSSRPILVPLGAAGLAARVRGWRNALPAAAAPVAVTLAGGLAIAVVIAGLADRDRAAPEATIEATADAPAPAASAGTDTTEVEDALQRADAAAQAPPPLVENAATLPVPLAGNGAAPVFETAEADAFAGSFAAPEPDAGWTSAIPPARPGGDLVPVVEIAETVAEVEALEAIQQREVEADLAAPSPEGESMAPSTEATSAIPPATVPRAPAVTTKWVNLRAGPSDDAEVLLVVPALETVQAETGCDWCAVSYDGRDGYIYKTLLSYEDGSEAAAVE